jgi:putative FmdB family regulatory protein
MPLLEFECEGCGSRFEELVASGAPVACPACGADAVRRLYSQVSPPRRVGMSRAAARDSDVRRSEREAQRRERFVEQRRARREK